MTKISGHNIIKHTITEDKLHPSVKLPKSDSNSFADRLSQSNWIETNIKSVSYIRNKPKFKGSINIESNEIRLINDEDEPGSNKVYVTNEEGVRGWKDLIESIYDTNALDLRYGRLAYPNTWEENNYFKKAISVGKDHVDFNIILDIVGNVQIDDGYIGSKDFDPELKGWRITNILGASLLDIQGIIANEIRAKAFIADLDLALLSGHIVTKSVTQVSRNFIVPSINATANLYVEDLPGFEGSQVFEDNDWIRLQVVDRSGGGLKWFKVWVTINPSSYNTAGEENPGEQSFVVTVRYAGISGSAVGETVNAGSAAQDWGQSGDGFIEMQSSGTDSRPYLRIGTWNADPSIPTNITSRVMLGNITNVIGNEGVQIGYDKTDNLTKLFIGNSQSSFDWGYFQDGRITIRGGITQRPSGEQVEQVVYRGGFVLGNTYYKGDEVMHNDILWLYHNDTATNNTTPGVDTAYWRKSDGEQGPPGSNAKTLQLITSSHVFHFDKDGNPNPTLQTITFTANGQNLDGSYSWSSDPAITLTGTGNTRELTIADFNSAGLDEIIVTATADDLSDTVTVIRVTDGDDGFGVFLTNESHTYPADPAGLVSSFADGYCQTRVYKGDTLLIADSTSTVLPTVNNTYRITGVSVVGTMSYGIAINSDNLEIRPFSMGTDQVTLSITIVARSRDTNYTFTKVLTYSKSRKGDIGEGMTNKGEWVAATYNPGDYVFAQGTQYVEGDWYLPSIDELIKVYNEIVAYSLGTYDITREYWSSTEVSTSDVNYTVLEGLNAGTVLQKGKYGDASGRVIPCRDFTSNAIYSLRDKGPQGGFIFHSVYLGSGLYKYYEAYPKDGYNSFINSYNNYWAFETSSTGATGTAIGTGKNNTQLILSSLATPEDTAAWVCDEILGYHQSMWVLIGNSSYVSTLPPIDDRDNWSEFKSVPGQDAKTIRLITSSNLFRFDKEGNYDPIGQVIDFVASEQNLGGSYTWTTDPDIGASLTGSVDTRSLTIEAFEAAGLTKLKVTVERDEFSDTVTIVRVTDGGDGFAIYLTNENHTYPADNLGNISNFTGGYCKVQLYQGSQLFTCPSTTTSLPSVNQTYKVTNISVTGTMSSSKVISSSQFEFRPTSMGTDEVTITLTIIARSNNENVEFTKIITYAKSRRGYDGADSKSISLTSNGTTFTFNSNNTPSPAGQSITLYASNSNLAGVYSWTTSPAVTLTGTGDTRSLSVEDFGSDKDSVLIQLSRDGLNDYIRINRVTHGEPGPSATGIQGPGIVYRGIYDPNVTYYKFEERVDVVYYNYSAETDNYWLVNVDTGIAGWLGSSIGSPGSNTYWKQFGGTYTSIATKLLLAENATITKTLIMGSSDPNNPMPDGEGAIQSANWDASGITGFSSEGYKLYFNGSIRTPSFYIDNDKTMGIRTKQLIYAYTEYSQHRLIVVSGEAYDWDSSEGGISMMIIHLNNTIRQGGLILSFRWSMKSDTGGTVYSTIYKNNIIYADPSPVWVSTQSTTYQMYQRDVEVNSGDIVELWGKTDGSYNTHVFVYDFSIMGTCVEPINEVSGTTLKYGLI